MPTGSQTYWRNAPDTTPADSEPDSAVAVSVNRGLYSVVLGDANTMAPIPAAIRNQADLWLRMWFNDGIRGFQRLSPDRRLGSVFGTQGPVPLLLNYQGRAAVAGVPFTGTGQLKFALINGNGTEVYWSNAPDSTPQDGEPDSSVGVPVNNGLYSLFLGDPDQMLSIDPSALAHPDLRLRVWFSDGSHGFQLLSPDQPVGNTVPNALLVQSAVLLG